MKAVVLEVRDGFAAVLREDGTVEKLRRDCQVGETIELNDETKLVRFPSKAAKWVAAAAAAVIVLSAGGTYGYNTAYAWSTVTLEGDASVVYVLNRQDRVIRVEAASEDGEALAEELTASGVKNATLSDAISMTTELLGERDGEKPDHEELVLRVSSRRDDREQRLTEELGAYFSDRADEGWNAVVTNGRVGPEAAPGTEAPAGNAPTDGSPGTGNLLPAERSQNGAEPQSEGTENGNTPQPERTENGRLEQQTTPRGANGGTQPTENAAEPAAHPDGTGSGEPAADGAKDAGQHSETAQANARTASEPAQGNQSSAHGGSGEPS